MGILNKIIGCPMKELQAELAQEKETVAELKADVFARDYDIECYLENLANQRKAIANLQSKLAIAKQDAVNRTGSTLYDLIGDKIEGLEPR